MFCFFFFFFSLIHYLLFWILVLRGLSTFLHKNHRGEKMEELIFPYFPFARHLEKKNNNPRIFSAVAILVRAKNAKLEVLPPFVYLLAIFINNFFLNEGISAGVLSWVFFLHQWKHWKKRGGAFFWATTGALTSHLGIANFLFLFYSF